MKQFIEVNADNRKRFVNVRQIAEVEDYNDRMELHIEGFGEKFNVSGAEQTAKIRHVLERLTFHRLG